jgi:transposase
MVRYVGLDVHKRDIVACIVDASGAVVERCTFRGTRAAIEQFAQQRLQPTDCVALEATTNSWAVARLLRPYVAQVVVSNPLLTRAIAAAKIKTDKIDAHKLAELLRCNYLPQVWQPDEATEELRTLCSRRAALVSESTRLKNRIHSALHQALIPTPEGELFGPTGRRWLRQQEFPPLVATLIESDLRLLEHCEEELARFDQLLAERAYAEPNVRLLMTLPGVNYPTAMAIAAALGDITRFQNGQNAAAYLGLIPSTYHSGGPRGRTYHGPITKRGNSKARWLLIQAAQHAGTHPGPLGAFFKRLAKRKNRNVAVVATARKLVVIAWHMLKNQEPYRYARPAATDTKLQALRVRATGERRKTGPAKGSPPSPNQGTGVRTRGIPSLPQVYEREGLPAATPPGRTAPGERRMLVEHGVEAYVAEIQAPQRKVRKVRGAAAERAPAEAVKKTG